MKQEIPIKNLYYLLSYAWEFVSKGTEKYLGIDNFTNTSNLMSRLMDFALRSLLRRGIYKEYDSLTEEIQGIRGKLILSQTLTTGKNKYGRTICTFDEFGFDHMVNQLIKASIKIILSQKSLSAENAIIMRGYVAQLEQVSDIKLTANLFSKLKLHSHNRHYKFILELCRLIADSLVISSESQEVLLSNFLEDSLKMDRIFEKFVKNFYSLHLKEAAVSSPKFNWEIEANDNLFAQRVPELRTDVVIDQKGNRLIIDAKYYVEAMRKTRSGVFKYRRDHLSQLMEYIRTSKKREIVPTRGMLLYPTVTSPIDDSGKLEGFDIRIATIDLSSHWEEIEKRLLGLVEYHPLKKRVA